MDLEHLVQVGEQPVQQTRGCEVVLEHGAVENSSQHFQFPHMTSLSVEKLWIEKIKKGRKKKSFIQSKTNVT
jgi:hypothetical protein